MSDYEITIKVRNARIVRAMRAAGMKTQADLARAANVGHTRVGKILAVKLPAYRKNAQWRSDVLRIADALGVMPDELFTERQAQGGLKNVTREIGEGDLDQIAALSGFQAIAPPDEMVLAAETRRMIEKSVAKLSPRLADVIRRRFGLPPYERDHTLEEIATALGITRERVRQMEAKALRQLRHPSNSTAMREAGLAIGPTWGG